MFYVSSGITTVALWLRRNISLSFLYILISLVDLESAKGELEVKCKLYLFPSSSLISVLWGEERSLLYFPEH